MDSKNVLKNTMPAEYKMGEQRGRKRRHEVCALDQGDYKIRLSEQLWKKGKENLQMKKLLRITGCRYFVTKTKWYRKETYVLISRCN